MQDLISEYGLDVVQSYMNHIQKNAETAVRDMLKEIGRKAVEEKGENVLVAEDFMDDGSKIKVKITIDIEQGSSVVDFT